MLTFKKTAIVYKYLNMTTLFIWLCRPDCWMVLTAMKGAIEHKVEPKIHSFLNADIGVIVADVQQTTKSEQLSEKMNIFGTVCNVL